MRLADIVEVAQEKKDSSDSLDAVISGSLKRR